MEKPYNHISVLLNESIQQLNIKKNGVYVDCTLGGGGHSSEILKRIPNGHLYAFDQDSFAINTADEKLKKIASNYTLINENFVNIKVALEEENVYGVDGILYDLGVSSFQLDIPERGFSYRFDGPLDMRMDQTAELDAYTVVNTYDEKSLVRILFEYGEEKFTRLIARKIVSEREKKPIETTLELVEIIKKALPASALRNSSHPARKTFQAIRIEVNNELGVLRDALEEAIEMLNVGGRISVITFHSLEDRIVKKLFKEKTTLQLPKDLPYIPEGYEIEFKLINSKVILPSESEISNNLRSHSAKMRVIEKI